jgi:hypothetical protein
VLVHVVADYGAGDLAFAEVAQRFAMHVPGALVVTTPVGPFDTLAAGFCVAQLALGEGPADRVVFHNVAPRQDIRQPRDANEGERLAAARLETGVWVVGANAGHTLSFLREEAVALNELDVPAAGSQFRSRDLFPQAVARLVGGDERVLCAPLDPAGLPAPPDSAIAYIDGYGNIKTTLTEPPAPTGTRVLVRIGGIAATAVVGDETFAVEEGDLALAPGSSGWPLRRGGRVAFFELLLRGASAAARFAHPTVGSPIEVAVP